MGFSVAIVGATGLVGKTLLGLLEERSFPLTEIYLIASQQSAGKSLKFRESDYPIHDLAQFDFKKTSIAFFCVSAELSAAYVPKAVENHNIVIDKSNYYRYHEKIPLIIPEVNLGALNHYKNMHIIANPNCTTIPISVALKPIYDAVGITRINIATYQSVSGSGKEGVTELEEQMKQWLTQQPIEPKVYTQQILLNVLPHIDEFQENGYTREEMKIVLEMKKIFEDAALAINPTAVRVPVFCGHGASVHIETKNKITASQAMQILQKAPGVKLMNGKEAYPTPLRDAAGKDEVYVGRVREDISHQKGLNLWIVADNLRKGAALNAVQIAENLIKYHL